MRDADEPLIRAARRQRIDEVEAALAQDVDIDAADGKGKTALMYAANSPEILSVLLRHQPDVHATDIWGQSALYVALNGRQYSCVKQLLEAGADPNKPFLLPRGSRSPLCITNEIGSVRGARLLLDYGADPWEKNRYTGDYVADGFGLRFRGIIRDARRAQRHQALQSDQPWPRRVRPRV